VRCEMWRRPRSIRVPASKKRTARARQRRGRDEDEGHRVNFANRSIITAKTSEYKDHTQTEREIDEVNVPGSGWLARAERGRRQRSTTTKGCLRRQTRGSRGREGQPRPWLTKTQEHPVQAPAALWIAGIFELASKGYRDQNTDLATRD
jgi:hypothetical protein